MRKRWWEIASAIALLAALGAAYPVGKARWEYWQKERELRASLLAAARKGDYGKLHDNAEEVRRWGLSRVPLANTAEELCLATAAGDQEQLASLLQQGADPNIPVTIPSDSISNGSEYIGVTPLWLASSYGYLSTVQLLLAYGARADVKNSSCYSGETALMRAARCGDCRIVELLLRHGAVLERRDPHGGTALWHAAANGHAAVLRVLIRHGAKVDVPAEWVPNHWMLTPLQWTAQYGQTETAQILIQAGAERNRHAGGGTPLLLAEQAGHADTVRIFRSLGCTH